MKRSSVIRILEKYKRVTTASLAARSRPYSYRDEIIWPRRIVHCEDTLRKYLYIWIRKLFSCECDDPFLTAVFINLYNAFQENRYDERSLKVTLKDEVANLLLLDRGLTDVREGINYGLMNVLRVIQTKDWEFLKVLIMYGIIRPKETLTSSEEESHALILNHFLFKITLMHGEYQQLMRFHDHFCNVLRKLNFNTLDSVDADEKERILRKYNVLKLLVCKDYLWGTNPSDTVLKCLNYYFQVIPDPFVTVREIEDVIEVTETSQSLFDRNLFGNFIILYSTQFPESGVLQPRSLQHLSRCAAREHLCKYGLLPKVVSRLMIPKAIKDYLLVVNPES